MLHLKEVPESNIVELTFDGAVSNEDFMVVTTILKNKIQKQGKIRILDEVKSFSRMPLKMVWEDLKFVFVHRKAIERAAVVTDQRWARWLASLARPVIPAQIKCFDHKDIRQARSWLASA